MAKKKKAVTPQLPADEIKRLANFERAISVYRKRQRELPSDDLENAVSPNLESYKKRLREDWLVINDTAPAKVLELPGFTLCWVDSAGREQKCRPDFLLTLLGSRKKPCLVSIVTEGEIRQDPITLRNVYAGSIAISEVKDWSFKVVTDRDIRTEFLNNIYFLSRYNQLQRDESKTHLLLTKLAKMKRATPRKLLSACAKDWQEQAELIPMLWYLLSRQEIATDYSVSLGMENPIRLGRCHRTLPRVWIPFAGASPI